MRFRFPRPVHFALCAVVALCGAQVRVEDCRFDLHHFVCTYPEATYHIRLPDNRVPGVKTPVIVLLHDAGQSGARILGNEPLLRTFRDAGFAVLAPDALPRRNRRLEYRYSGNRRPMFGNLDGASWVEYSQRKFLIETPDGGQRVLDFDVDRGWYFHSTDRMIYVNLRNYRAEADSEYDFIGRDEIQALRDVLDHSARENGTAEKPALILGFGHGGSLVWQIACHAPGLADLLVPVGGAFWGELPDSCQPGARLLHTHERTSTFWPLSGAPGSRRRYTRTGVQDNIDLLLKDNWCSGEPTTGGRGGSSASLTTWADCVDGGPVELMVLDQPFAFQNWWFSELLSRMEPADGDPADGEPAAVPETPDARKPVFKRPKARSTN